MTNIVSIRRAAPIRMVWIDRPLVCLTTTAAARWRCWLGLHGLDPDLICLDQAIVCDDDACTISLQVWEELPQSGRSRPVRQEVTLQLAMPAFPFPEETGYAAWSCALDDEFEEQDVEVEEQDEEFEEQDEEYPLAA